MYSSSTLCIINCFVIFSVEKKREEVGEGVTQPSSKKKRLEKQEEQLKECNRELTMVSKVHLLTSLLTLLGIV